MARIIDSAQPILRALADDPAAGFDGNQSVDLSAPDDAGRYGSVDKQVQALWYALLDSHGQSYINPPPRYAYDTQRLRTPSQLLAERRGTCIDVALLLAACLEYFDLSGDLPDHPPRLCRLRRAVAAPTTRATCSISTRRQEVRDRVFQRALVPLEATWLTSRGGFESAAAEGQYNLRDPKEFQAMIDVRLARDRGVTPLPLLGNTVR